MYRLLFCIFTLISLSYVSVSASEDASTQSESKTTFRIPKEAVSPSYLKESIKEKAIEEELFRKWMENWEDQKRAKEFELEQTKDKIDRAQALKLQLISDFKKSPQDEFNQIVKDKITYSWFTEEISNLRNVIFFAVGNSKTDYKLPENIEKAARIGRILKSFVQDEKFIVYDADSAVARLIETNVNRRLRLGLSGKADILAENTVVIERPFSRLKAILSIPNIIVSSDSLLAAGLLLGRQGDSNRFHIMESEEPFKMGLTRWEQEIDRRSRSTLQISQSGTLDQERSCGESFPLSVHPGLSLRSNPSQILESKLQPPENGGQVGSHEEGGGFTQMAVLPSSQQKKGTGRISKFFGLIRKQNKVTKILQPSDSDWGLNHLELYGDKEFSPAAIKKGLLIPVERAKFENLGIRFSKFEPMNEYLNESDLIDALVMKQDYLSYSDLYSYAYYDYNYSFYQTGSRPTQKAFPEPIHFVKSIARFGTEELFRFYEFCSHYFEQTVSINIDPRSEKGSLKSAVLFGSAQGAKYFEPLVESTVAEFVHLGFSIATGGAGGFMETANRIAFQGNAYSIGVPLVSHWTPNYEREINSKYHFRTVEVDNYESRISLLLQNRQMILFAPGGMGTMKELASTLFMLASKTASKTYILFLSSEYYGGLFDWLKKLKLPEELLQRMFLVNSLEEVRGVVMRDL